MAALETQVEDISISATDHTRAIDLLREENEALQSKIEDAKNRSRRSNIRIRGLPEMCSPWLWPYFRSWHRIYQRTDWR